MGKWEALGLLVCLSALVLMQAAPPFLRNERPGIVPLHACLLTIKQLISAKVWMVRSHFQVKVKYTTGHCFSAVSELKGATKNAPSILWFYGAV